MGTDPDLESRVQSLESTAFRYGYRLERLEADKASELEQRVAALEQLLRSHGELLEKIVNHQGV